MKNLLQVERKPIVIGEFFHNTQCRFCYSNDLKLVMDFGNVPLAGGFLSKNSKAIDFKNEKLYPLEIYFCPKCFLVQSNNVISPDELFKRYFYFSSTIPSLVSHFKSYSKQLKKYFRNPSKTVVLEIGCNDGVFLKPLKREGFKVIGVDPAVNVVKPLKREGFKVVNTYFTEKNAQKILKNHGKADVICGTSSLAHIDDMHDVLGGVKTLLRDDGIFILEEHYLGNLIDEAQYDMMYHEHPSYYSLLSLSEFLEMFDMHVFNVKSSTLRAGLMRYYIQNTKGGKRKITDKVKKLLKQEKKKKFNEYKSYKNFYRRVDKTRKDLMKLLIKLKKQNKSLIGYGASGRATVIMSFCGITDKHLDYIVDDASTRQDIFMPGNHIPVKSSDVLDNPETRPDYVLVFAWPFINDIRKKNKEFLRSGGKFIIPLPKVKIVS